MAEQLEHRDWFKDWVLVVDKRPFSGVHPHLPSVPALDNGQQWPLEPLVPRERYVLEQHRLAVLLQETHNHLVPFPVERYHHDRHLTQLEVYSVAQQVGRV